MAAARLMDGKLNTKMETLLLEVQIDQKKKQATAMEADVKVLETMLQDKKVSFEGLRERVAEMRRVLAHVQNIEPEVCGDDYITQVTNQIVAMQSTETAWSESFDTAMSTLQENVKQWSEQKTKLEADNEALGAECWSLKEALVVGEQRKQRIDSEQAMAVEQARLAGLLSQTVLPHLPKTARRSLAHVGNPAMSMRPPPNDASAAQENGTPADSTAQTTAQITPDHKTTGPPNSAHPTKVEAPTMPTYGLDSSPPTPTAGASGSDVLAPSDT